MLERFPSRRLGPIERPQSARSECRPGGPYGALRKAPRLRALSIVLLATLATFPATAAAQGRDVEVELEQFGVGSDFRAGDVTAIALRLTSSLREPTPCFVQWEIPNADGDIAEYGRSVTLTPGAATRVWLYAPLGPLASNQSIYTVRVFEERDGKRRREISGARISPSLASALGHDIAKSMIAVIGRSKMGLDDLGNPWPPHPSPPGAHEETRIVSGISPSDLPDRWEGLSGFEAIVWSDAPPQDLRVDSANAIREYVRRGGHLIIGLPGAGNPWGLGAIGQTELEDLLPHQAPRKDEDVKLSTLLPILSKTDRIRRDIAVSTRVFKTIGGEFDVLDNSYEPLIALPDGRVVVVQRTYGFGRVTIIGIDLSSRQLWSLGLPQGDVFWNRILGRRADTPRPVEVRAMETADRLTDRNRQATNLGSGGLFKQQISMSRGAGQGLLLVLLFFVVYFLVAGPGGYHALKHYRMTKHAWLAFAASAGVFTAIAWGAVGLLRENDVTVKHVTFLDHLARPADDRRIDEPQFQRASSWFSLYLPGYGKSRVAIESTPGQRDLLFSFNPPGEIVTKFPNVDRYLIDVGRDPADYLLPSRSTATQMYARWLGALDGEWGGMLHVDPDNPIEELPMARGVESPLSGTLVHSLPGELRHVLVIYVSNDRSSRRTYESDGDAEQKWVPPRRSGEVLNRAYMWSPASGRWLPGVPYRLEVELRLPRGKSRRDYRLERTIDDRYLEGLKRRFGRGLTGPLNRGDIRHYMEMLGIYHQLTPPNYLKGAGGKEPETVIASREIGRELDLSAWFSRPCVIILGYLEDSPCPIPLRVDGKPPATAPGSLTIVRWIYPLPLDEAKVVPEEGPK